MAKSIMIQGTMSNVGKSLIVAGLCRIFAQDGYRVAPFKSQNMALNGFVMESGLEMSRAQAMQAEAAGIEPNVWMNPILLKPGSDQGSHVIVDGENRGMMRATDYFQYKKTLRPTVRHAYDRLAETNDMIVLEGAGSPAEINLKSDDIVNMGMAEMAKAPVLLVGDIDSGGVFAQLYGTMQLLDMRERERVKGVIVNKFRGDIEIFRPGLVPLEKLCERPVLGVVPYMTLDIDDEDSLSFRQMTGKRGVLDVAVVHLPRIMYFTEFNPLSRHEKIGLRYVALAEQLGRPDLLILPGSADTMESMRWLRESGLAACIQLLEQSGTPILGVGTSYSILGETLCDSTGDMQGLGLLPICSSQTSTQVQTRVKATVSISKGAFSFLEGIQIEGFMLNEWRITGSHMPVLMQRKENVENVPVGDTSGRVLGTAIHGFFDAEGMVDRFVDWLLAERGLPTMEAQTVTNKMYKNHQYDLLAAGLRSALDMDEIYRIVEKGI